MKHVCCLLQAETPAATVLQHISMFRMQLKSMRLQQRCTCTVYTNPCTLTVFMQACKQGSPARLKPAARLNLVQPHGPQRLEPDSQCILPAGISGRPLQQPESRELTSETTSWGILLHSSRAVHVALL